MSGEARDEDESDIHDAELQEQIAMDTRPPSTAPTNGPFRLSLQLEHEADCDQRELDNADLMDHQADLERGKESRWHWTSTIGPQAIAEADEELDRPWEEMYDEPELVTEEEDGSSSMGELEGMDTDSEPEAPKKNILVECTCGSDRTWLWATEGVRLGLMVERALNHWKLFKSDAYPQLNGRWRPEDHPVQEGDRISLSPCLRGGMEVEEVENEVAQSTPDQNALLQRLQAQLLQQHAQQAQQPTAPDSTGMTQEMMTLNLSELVPSGNGTAAQLESFKNRWQELHNNLAQRKAAAEEADADITRAKRLGEDRSARVTQAEVLARINLVEPILAVNLRCVAAVESEILNLLAAHPALVAQVAQGVGSRAPPPGLVNPAGPSTSDSSPQGPPQGPPQQQAEDPAAIPTPEDEDLNNPNRSMAVDQVEEQDTRTVLPEPSKYLAKKWTDFTEETLAVYAEHIQAIRDTSPQELLSNTGLEYTKTFENYEGIVNYLKATGSKPDDESPWAFLGIARSEGPSPTIEIIEDRARRMEEVLLVARALSHLGHAAHQKLELLAGRILAARMMCLEQLPKAQAEKKKRSTAEAYPTFMEPPDGLEEFILQVLRGEEVEICSLLHLSKVWTSRLVQDIRKPDVSTTKQIAEDFCRGAIKMKGAWDLCQARTVVMWAPQAAEHTNRMMAGFQELLKKGGTQRQILLVIPREQTPGDLDGELLQDIWSHAALQPKWNSLRAETWHLKESGLMVSTNSEAPSQLKKAFSLIKLNATGAQAEPQMLSWREEFIYNDSNHVIWVDMPAKGSISTMADIGRKHGDLVEDWEGPLRSPATSRQEQRVVFKVYLREGDTTEFEGIFLAKDINADLGHQGIAAAPQSLLTDRSARIMEFTHVRALRKTARWLDSVLVVAPRLALIHSTTSRPDWEGKMTQMMRDVPEEAISGIKWRKSQHGGRSWAKPAMCEAQIKGLVQQTLHVRDDGELQKVMISIPGSLGKQPDGLMQKLVHEIGKILGNTVGLVDSEADLSDYKIWPDKGTNNTWKGSLILMCSSAPQAEQTMASLNGKPIIINGHRAAIQAFHAASAARGGPCRA